MVDTAKFLIYHRGGEFVLTHGLGLQAVYIIYIAGPAGKVKSCKQSQEQQGRHYKPGDHAELSHRRDIGHKTPVMRLVNGPGKVQQQSRHQKEHRHQAQNNGLGQDNPHIVTDAELHEHHGHHARHGGQGTGGNLRDRLTQGHDHRLSGVLVLMLLHEAVRQDNGIVHRQSKL